MALRLTSVRVRRNLATRLACSIGLVGLLILAGGCGSSSIVKDDVLAGLDPAVAQEVLADPNARDTLGTFEGEQRDGLAQGMVINFIVCRDALRVLENWRSTGEQVELAPLPQPDNPVAPFFGEWQERYDDLKATYATGEVAALAEWVGGPYGCGIQVPAIPGDPSGPTVADRAVAGQ